MAKLDKEVYDSLKFNDNYVYVPLPTKVANMIKRKWKKENKQYVLVSFITKGKKYNEYEWEETMILGYFSINDGCVSRGPAIAHTVNGCELNAQRSKDWMEMAKELLNQDPRIEVKHKYCCIVSG